MRSFITRKATRPSVTLVTFATAWHLILAAAWAETPEVCAEAKTQLEMGECMAKERDRAEQDLEEIYSEIVHGIDGDQKERLGVAEEAWISYREAHCQFVSAEYEGGSAESLSFVICYREVTVHRTVELRAILDSWKEMGRISD